MRLPNRLKKLFSKRPEINHNPNNIAKVRVSSVGQKLLTIPKKSTLVEGDFVILSKLETKGR